MKTNSTEAFESAAAFLQTDLFRKGDRQQQTIGLAVYRLLAMAQPVSVEAIATVTDTDAAAVRAAVRATSRSATQWDEDRRIVGYAGLTLKPTRHGLTVDGQTLYTWCAFDSLFVPEILAKSVLVKSTCPITKIEIQLAISPDRVERVVPETAVISFVTPGKDRCEADVRGAFCQHVNFFRSSATARTWKSDNSGALVFSIREAFELARLRNRVAFGEGPGGLTDFAPRWTMRRTA